MFPIAKHTKCSNGKKTMSSFAKEQFALEETQYIRSRMSRGGERGELVLGFELNIGTTERAVKLHLCRADRQNYYQ